MRIDDAVWGQYVREGQMFNPMTTSCVDLSTALPALLMLNKSKSQTWQERVVDSLLATCFRTNEPSKAQFTTK